MRGRDIRRTPKTRLSKGIIYVKPKAGGIFIIDEIDKDLLDLCTWHIDGKHVASEIKGKKVYLHKLIGQRLGFPPDTKFIDHRNREPRDNRRLNLRPATRSLNSLNKAPLNNKLGIAGVHWDKINKVWDVKCGKGRRKVLKHLADAIALRNKWYKEKELEEEKKAWG